MNLNTMNIGENVLIDIDFDWDGELYFFERILFCKDTFFSITISSNVFIDNL